MYNCAIYHITKESYKTFNRDLRFFMINSIQINSRKEN